MFMIICKFLVQISIVIGMDSVIIKMVKLLEVQEEDMVEEYQEELEVDMVDKDQEEVEVDMVDKEDMVDKVDMVDKEEVEVDMVEDQVDLVSQ